MGNRCWPVLLAAVVGWPLWGRVQPAADTAFAAAPTDQSPANKPVGDDDPAHLTLRMIREPTPAWIPKPVEEIPASRAADPAAMRRYAEQIPGTGVEFEMTPVPGGRFKMGSPKQETDRAEDEGPIHEVRIDPFWMEVHEVTWEEYDQWAMRLDKKRRESQRSPASNGDLVVDAIAQSLGGLHRHVLWHGEGRASGREHDPVRGEGLLQVALGEDRPVLPPAHRGRMGIRLPGGHHNRLLLRQRPAKLEEYAWFVDNSDDKYHKVGKKKPNPWGLYDMHGNVAEWCVDQYAADAYRRREGKAADNPLDPSTAEYGRIVRGGSWDDPAAGCRSAARRASTKDWKKHDPKLPQSIWYLTDASFVGFRVVRPFRLPTAEEARKYEVDEVQLKAYESYVGGQTKTKKP